MGFIKKNWSNLLLLALIIILIVPATRTPLMVEINRLFAFDPSEIPEEERQMLRDYSWDLYTPEGEKINFTGEKGEVVIVNFWATWCPPCIAEMPSFEKLFLDYKDRISFYFVTSEEPETIQKFISENDYSFPVVRPGSMPPVQLQSKILPTTYVLSREGEIVVAKKGSADWNSEDFRTLLDELLLQK